MNGQQLKHVNEEKDLGLLIDNDLKFHKQTAEAIKKGKSVLVLNKKSCAILDKRTLPLLYKSLVRPHLKYSNVIWGSFFTGDIIAIENVQRRATKLVPLLKDLTYEARLRALNLPSLAHRRRGDTIYTYKIITEKMNMHKKDFSEVSQLTTSGHQYQIYKERAAKLPRINTFSNRIINDWNGLTSEIVRAASTNSFKNKLDKQWKKRIFDAPF